MRNNIRDDYALLEHQIDKEDYLSKMLDLLDNWYMLPKYQLERRADIFFALFLPEIIRTIYKIETRNVSIIPEFPLKDEKRSKETGHKYSKNIELDDEGVKTISFGDVIDCLEKEYPTAERFCQSLKKWEIYEYEALKRRKKEDYNNYIAPRIQFTCLNAEENVK